MRVRSCCQTSPCIQTKPWRLFTTRRVCFCRRLTRPESRCIRRYGNRVRPANRLSQQRRRTGWIWSADCMPAALSRQSRFVQNDGGEGGIRTPGTGKGTSDFESGALNRALPPLRFGYIHLQHWCQWPCATRPTATVSLLAKVWRWQCQGVFLAAGAQARCETCSRNRWKYRRLTLA